MHIPVPLFPLLVASSADLVFFQNGMLDPWLASRGLADATQVLVYFAVAKMGDSPIDGVTDLNPEGLTAASGKWAGAVAARLHSAGLSCKVLSREEFEKPMLEKLIWISAFMLVGVRNANASIGDVESKYRQEVLYCSVHIVCCVVLLQYTSTCACSQGHLLAVTCSRSDASLSQSSHVQAAPLLVATRHLLLAAHCDKHTTAQPVTPTLPLSAGALCTLRLQVGQLIEELASATCLHMRQQPGREGFAFDDGLVERLCAYARSVAHYPTAIKEVSTLTQPSCLHTVPHLTVLCMDSKQDVPVTGGGGSCFCSGSVTA